MRTTQAIFLSVILTIAVRGMGQTLNPGEWRTYTSMRTVTSVAMGADSLHAWVATTGGAFETDLRETPPQLTPFRTTNGLSENDLTAVAADSAGNIYFGGGSGGFDIYNSSNGAISQVPDIHNAPYPNKTINGITVVGPKIYLATAYGISVYLPAKQVFDITATQIATMPENDSIAQVIANGGFVYAAASEGVAWASEAADLHASTNWNLISSPGAVRSLVLFKGTNYAGTVKGLYRISTSPDSLMSVALPFADTLTIEQMLVVGDSLYLLDAGGTLYATADLSHFSVRALSAQTNSLVTSVAYSPTVGIVSGSALNGISYSIAGILENNIYPSGPIVSAVSFIQFSPTTDKLYATEGGAGISVFSPDSDVWQNFESGVGTTPNVEFQKVLYDSVRNVTWFSTFLSPLYKVQNLVGGNPVWQGFDNLHNNIPSFAGNSGGAVTSGMALDNNGNFLLTDWAGNGDGLVRSTDGTTFTAFNLTTPRPDELGLPFGCVTQDLNGNYWVGTERHDFPKSVGLYWYNPTDGSNGAIDGGSAGNLGSAVEGTEYVNAVLTDQDGAIWCATEAGVQILSNPEAILEGPDPAFSFRTVQFTTNQVVYTMTVDGVGNKWMGTDNGIFVVSADGSDSVAHFTAENSPLVNDVVTSLAIDPNRGEAYAVTPLGISRFSTIFKEGRSDYDSIRVYPNPVLETASVYPPYLVHIDGLVAGSTIQIFSIAGRLITTIDGSKEGAEVDWNGRDALGRQVPSGLYLISATSPQTSQSGEAKVVIVREPSN